MTYAGFIDSPAFRLEHDSSEDEMSHEFSGDQPKTGQLG